MALNGNKGRALPTVPRPVREIPAPARQSEGEGAPPRGGPIRGWVRGQQKLFEQVDRALREDRLGHSYLLLGPSGAGKLRTALALAQQLLCEDDAALTAGGAGCGCCPACERVQRLVHPDLHILVPLIKDDAEDDAARALASYAADPLGILERTPRSSIGIDRVRRLKEEAAKARIEASRRVAIISGAERMTEQAAQAALKLIEEPPPQTVLFLTAEDAAQLLPTILSRCQRLALRLLPREEIIAVLEEAGEAPASARLLAALSGGALGRALALRGAGLLGLRRAMADTFGCATEGLKPGEVERRVQALERSGSLDSLVAIAQLLLLWYEDLLRASCGLPADRLNHADLAGEAARQGALLGAPEIGRRVRIVEEMLRALQQNVNPGLAASAALSRIGALPGEIGWAL